MRIVITNNENARQYIIIIREDFYKIRKQLSKKKSEKIDNKESNKGKIAKKIRTR